MTKDTEETVSFYWTAREGGGEGGGPLVIWKENFENLMILIFNFLEDD